MSSIESFLRRFVLVGVFALPFISLLIVDFLFFPFITGKNFAFRIIVECIFGAWVYLALLRKEYRPRFSWLLASFLAFLSVMAVADFLSVNPSKSFWSNFERMEGYITLLHLFAYFIVAGAVLSGEKMWTRLWNTSIVASLLVAGYGYLQLFGFVKIAQSAVRLDSTLGNASYLAGYMLFHIFLSAILLSRTWKTATLRYIYIGVIFLESVILYHTATRGAILGLLGGALLSTVIIALFEKERRLFRHIALGFIASLILLVGGFFALRDTSLVTGSPVLSRFSQITLGESGVNARLIIWGMAWQGVKERPLLGWGQESFNYVFNAHYDPRLYSQEQWFDRVHNLIFDWLIAGGFLGLLSYLSLFVASLWYLWFSKREDPAFSIEEKALLTGLLSAYIFHTLFVFDNITSYLFMVTLLAYIHARSTRAREPLFAHRETDPQVIARAGAPIVLALALFSLYFFNWSSISTAHTLIGALSPQGDIQKNVQMFKQAIANDSFGTQEVREQIMTTASNLLRVNIDPAIKQQFVTFALDELKAQVTERPGDARTLVFLGSMFDQAGDYTHAIPVFSEALAVSPQKQQIHVALANSYLGAHDTTSALKELSYALSLDTKNDEARIAYAAGAIYAGDIALSDRLLSEGFGTTVVPDDRLIQAYGKTNRFDRLLLIWQKKVTDDPNNSGNHVSLGATYLALGQRADAVKELKRAIELDPSFTQQGNYFISEIEAGRNP